MKNSLLFLLAAGLLSYCCITGCAIKENTIVEKVEPPLIQPPIPSLVQAFETREFDVAKGVVWRFANGTKITIPPNALIRPDSTVHIGKAIVKFRDYHTASDVFLSGIPMNYAEDGRESGNMQTAGMFELRVEAEGQPLLLNDGEKAKVQLATQIGGKGYDAYYLDEAEKKWTYLEPNKARVNQKKKQLRKVVEEIRPGIPFPLNRQYFTLDYNTLRDIYFKDNLKLFDDVLLKQQLESYGLDWLNSESFDGVVYNGVKKPAALMVWKRVGQDEFPDFVENSQSKFFPIGNNQYQMRIINKENTDSVDLKVELVMPLKYLFQLSPEEWANDYQLALNKFKKEEKRMKLMSDFMRNLDVSNFGIYNYDRIMKEDEAVLLLAQFDFRQQFDENVSQPDIYYVPGTGRAVVKYPQSQWDEFPLMPDKQGLLFSLLPDNELVVYDRTSYAKIDFEPLRGKDSPSYKFEMKYLKKIKTHEDIAKVLDL